MHSTVQTGLFTPNIYNCEHNMHNLHSHNRNNQYHVPPHHHHLNNQRTHAKDASLHSSLLGINVLHSSHAEGLNKHDNSRNNLSASNITFSSNKNLSYDLNPKQNESSLSSSSINKLSVRNSNEDNNRLSHHSVENIVEKENFWNYTKPCGFLTLVAGFMLLVSSLVCFVLVSSKYVCRLAFTCSNAMVILGAVSCLVIGIVMIFFGVVIVIYSKKDSQAKVIFARASEFDRKVNKVYHKANKNNGSLPLLNNI